MSFATLLGVLFSFGLFIGSVVMGTSHYVVFINLPSFVMVVGGTFAATFVAYEPRYVLNALKIMRSIFFAPRIGWQVLTSEGRARHPLGLHRSKERPARAGG